MALTQCRNALAEQSLTKQSLTKQSLTKQATPKISGICELVRMDDVVVAPARELLSSAQNTPLYLWRVASPTATVYLGGTVHILKESLYPLPQQYVDAYDATEKLVFEVDLSRYPPAQVQQLTLSNAKLSNQTLRQSLPASTYQQLVDAGQLYGLPIGQMQGFKPMLAFQQLSVMGFMALGYDPEFGMDHYFGQLGRRQPEHILQLESLEMQLNLLFNQPLDVQTAVLQQALDELDNLEPATSDLIRAFFTGDDGLLMQLIEDQAGDHPLTKAFNEQLLDQRNRNMTREIVRYLNTANSYLVLVGAAHLAGPKGIVTLLERAGFQPERIYAQQSLQSTRQ